VPRKGSAAQAMLDNADMKNSVSSIAKNRISVSLLVCQ
jgi:hypothetical protein